MSRKSEKNPRNGKTASSGSGETWGGLTRSDGSVWRNNWWPGLLLVAAVCIAYQQVWQAGFIWDDNGHVTGPDLRSLHGLWRIWFEPGATQQYYPVLHSAFWVEHRLWGDSAAGYHLANLLLHGTAAFLLYRVLRCRAVPGAFLAAAAFALHPVCVESVAWISEQKNTLSAVFYLAAALAYFRFDRERRAGWYALATGLFGLALASKSVTATLPAALLVVQWWQRGRLSWRGDVRPLVPWFLLAACAGAVTVWIERTFIGANGAAFSLGPVDRFLVAGRSVWFYLGKILWPVDLTFIYPRWDIDDHAAWQYLFPAATAVALAGLVALRKRARGPLAAALLFTGTLFPALGFINIFPFVYSFVADHFQYLAAAMMISAFVAGFTRVADRLPPPGRIAARLAAACVVAVLAGLTWHQCAMYADAETLWRTTLARNPDCWMACDNLGNIFLKKGLVEQAVAQFQRALVIKPDDDFAQNNLGFVLLHAGQLEPAVARFDDAIAINPDNAEAHNNLGLALLQEGRVDLALAHFQKALALKDRYPAADFNLGNALLQAGRVAQALAHFEMALESEPENAEIHHRLADALLKVGQVNEAIAHYRKSLEIDPNFAQAHLSLAHVLLQEGPGDEAVTQFRAALAIEPNDVEANNDLGAVLLQRGQVDEAVGQFQKALAIKDDYAEAHFNLANVLLQRGDATGARAHYQKALETEPNNARAHNNLGLALLREGKTDEAAGHFQKALEIDPGYAQARRNLDTVSSGKR